MPFNKNQLLVKEIFSESELSEVVLFLQPLLTDKSCIFLTGDLAAGKTTFVNYFCRSHGISDCASPTFALHHSYTGINQKIDHFDLYRLSTAEDVETTGLWDVLVQPKCLVFIEWSERINAEDIPLDFKLIEINFKKVSESGRLITLTSLT